MQNLRQQYRKPSRRGFQIISHMSNLNVKLALANQRIDGLKGHILSLFFFSRKITWIVTPNNQNTCNTSVYYLYGWVKTFFKICIELY